ncbi:hypothetical protein LTR65_003101 [Meristemomyces frigidus]
MEVYPLLRWGPASDVHAPTPDLMEDDDGDDESGGVPIDLSDIDQDMTDAFAGTHLAGAQPGSSVCTTDTEAATRHAEHSMPSPGLSREYALTMDRLHDRPERVGFSNTTAAPRTSYLYPASASVLGSSHPRPHSQESREEEDGRRLRFALDGEDISEVPRFALPEDMTTGDGRDAAEMIGTDNDSLRTASATSQDLDNLSPDRQAINARHISLLRRSRSIEFASLRLHHSAVPTIPGTTQTQSTNEAALMHSVSTDDYLTVDDPKWSYDFADFIDTWRLRSLAGKQIPPFDPPGQLSSARFTKPLEEVSRKEHCLQGVDMQGLQWQIIGPSRDDAIAARVKLHHSRHQLGPLSTPPANTSEKHLTNAESSYRFRSSSSKHRAHFSHYQLRNLLAATNRSDIYYANGNTVYQTSLACPSVQNVVMDLSKQSESDASFRITCLTTSPSPTFAFSAYRSHNLVIAGGFYGEYTLRNMGGDTAPSSHEGFVTHAYNGLVTHVHAFTGRRSGLPQGAFCSNDHKLRLMDTSRLCFTDTFAYDHAVNCAATSPEGRLRVLVGDSHEAQITDAERGNTLVTLRGHADHGFSCAWAPNGIHVATGAQDGTTLVWDARNWHQPVRSLPSVMSSPRSLHFTDNDTLVVAEDDDVVSIYQPGSFDKSQDIRFFGSIAGVALLDGGAEIAVANIDKTVGGLLTFERTAQGVNGAAFGRRVVPGQRMSRRRVEASCPSDFTMDVFV